MIRSVYLDFIKDKFRKKEMGWLLKKGMQYLLVQASFWARRPFCGPILCTFLTDYRCNYRCAMCELPLREEELKKQGRQELSTGESKQLLKEIASLGVAGIGFTGGEPLLRPDIFELMALTKELGMICHLNTNGFFLDDEKAGMLLESGADSLNISLDGATAGTHDAIRGHPGAFDSAVAAVRRVQRQRSMTHSPIRIKIVTVLNETNIDEVPQLLDLARDLNTDCIEFIPQQYFSALCRQQKERYASPEFTGKVRAATAYLKRMKRQGERIENSYRHLGLFEDSFRDLKSPLVCYAGYNSFAVDCYGELYPCMPWINLARSVGNLKGTTIGRFWYSKDYNMRRRDILGCRGCYLNCQAELNLLFNPLRRNPLWL